MAKEGLFNILENKVYWENIAVLDLFAGTGNMSIEFLSRGAKSVLSIDSHPVSAKHLRKLKAEFDEENWRILKRDVFKFIPKHEGVYDLIFADPPFELGGVDGLPNLIFENKRLAVDGTLIVEHGRDICFESHQRWVDVRNYGGVFFSIFG